MSGFELARWLPSTVAGWFAFAMLVCGPGAAAAEVGIACSSPSVEAGSLVVLRCHAVTSVPGSAWRASFGGQERACEGVPVGSALPAGRGAQCGVVGDGIWFWQRLAPAERGALRYRSWLRSGVWRVEGGELLPSLLRVGSSVVTSGRWDGSVALPYARFRDRGWLGGSVASVRSGAVSVVAEAGVAEFSAPVLEELGRLRGLGWGAAIRDVHLLAASRSDYASGRSGPGWLVLELGEEANRQRVVEVLRHEVAHQLVGGALRYVRDGRDVGWFLEGFAEYLGFALAREGTAGRAAFYRRFGEACEAVSRAQAGISDYDLGFLYAAAVDGALWRGASVGLLERLAALVAGRAEPVVFGGREDFLGKEPREELVTSLLAGADDAGAERARGWMVREERPDVAALAGDLGVELAKESLPMNGLPVSMRERQDGLFEVTSVEAAVAETLGISPGDLIWPLAAWSGTGAVTAEVSRTFGWQRVTLTPRRVIRERWRVVSVADAERRWFGGPVSSRSGESE